MSEGKNMKWMGMAILILGILCVGAPLMTGLAVTTLVGLLMLVAGIFRAVGAFKAGSFGSGLLALLLGALTTLCGLYLLTRPVSALAGLTLLLAAYFIVDGIFEMIAAFQIKPAEGWGWELFGGLVSLLLGVMIWRQWPVSGAWALGILVGVKLMFAGMASIAVGSAVARVSTAVTERIDAAASEEE